MKEWVGTCGHSTEIHENFPKIAEGSEHYVYFDATNAKVFKATKKGIFGKSYYLEDGKMGQRNCSPLDYLIRLRLWKHVFGSAPRPLGITTHGQIVSVHDFISGVLPEQDELDLFLEAAEFSPIRRKFWFWEKVYSKDGYAIRLGDARDENFVKGKDGIVPIDVRLWFA